MNTMKNYPMSLTRLANKFGMSRDNILYFLDEKMGYVNGIREITEKGKKNGVSYAYCRVDECEYDYSMFLWCMNYLACMEIVQVLPDIKSLQFT